MFEQDHVLDLILDNEHDDIESIRRETQLYFPLFFLNKFLYKYNVNDKEQILYMS